jgi:hypothetical protein
MGRRSPQKAKRASQKRHGAVRGTNSPRKRRKAATKAKVSSAGKNVKVSAAGRKATVSAAGKKAKAPAMSKNRSAKRARCAQNLLEQNATPSRALSYDETPGPTAASPTDSSMSSPTELAATVSDATRLIRNQVKF